MLIGNTDIGDALQRLDSLTEEEDRIASAEILRTTHALGEGLRDVGRGVEDMVGDMQRAHVRFDSVHGRVQDVRDTVQDINVGLRGVGHGVQDIGDNVLSVRDKVDCTNCQHFSNLLSLLIHLIYPLREPPQR